MKLYTYFRSSAAYRVRIALNLKGLPWEAAAVHLARDGGEQHSDAYRAVNPAALVPTLDDRGVTLTQSLAIIEYLEEMRPQPALLPSNLIARARVRAVAQAIACDIHPINNLRVLKYLTGEMGLSEDQKMQWYRHWVDTGLAAVEAALADLRRGSASAGELGSAPDPLTLGAAVRRAGAGLVVVSVPGSHAVTEAFDAIDACASVMLFSDNVSVADEIALYGRTGVPTDARREDSGVEAGRQA